MIKTFPVLMPHSPEQREILYGDSNLYVRAGRRFGKSISSVWRMVRTIMQREGDVVFVAPSYGAASMRAARQAINEIHTMLWRMTGVDVDTKLSKSERVWTFPGGTLSLRSADSPDSIRGGAFVAAALDEFAFWKDPVDILREVVQPTLLDKGGSILITTTPKHATHSSSVFYDDCETLPHWKTVHAPTWINPFLNAQALEEIRSSTPEFVWRQEYEAICGAASGYLFGTLQIDDEVRMEFAPSGSRPGDFIIACDWAGTGTDRTVFAVYDKLERAVVHVEAFSAAGSDQLYALQQLWMRFAQCSIVAEVNGLGRPLVDRGHELGLPIEEWTMTNASKTEAAFYLASQIEQGAIRFLDDSELIDEFAHYRVSQSPNGGFKLGAEGSKHDDIPTAVMIAVASGRYSVGI